MGPRRRREQPAEDAAVTGVSHRQLRRPEFTVISRRTVEIDRDDLCADCRHRFDLIEAEIAFGGDGYPCDECKARILARERGFAREHSTVTPKVPR
jgi:DNA-directed RNA polymerase subunit RPC12/RpoP